MEGQRDEGAGTVTRLNTGARWSGLVVLGSIGAVFFAVSLDHAHQLFAENGQGGWVAVALAVVVAMFALGSTLELARRVHMREPVAPAAAALLVGVGVEGWGNLATAAEGPAGHLLAGFPTFGTLILLWVFESARTAARARRAAAEERRQREAPERELTRVRDQRAEAEAAALTRSADPVPQADPDPISDPAPASDPVPAARVRTRSSRRSDPVQSPVKVGVPETVKVALAHRTEHGELPGQAALARLAGASESTAKRALKEIRETPLIHLVRPTA